MEYHALIILGGGPAGLAAALAAREAGVEDILILERDRALGGILNQCIHNGFGLHTFQEELTGPEYAARYARQVLDAGIACQLDTMVLSLSPERVVTAISPAGLRRMQAGAVVLAMGCRERPRGALNIPGFRSAGIYSAGTAQRLVNLEGKLPGRDVVILGSGDIGLIMARRMTLEGAKVHAVAELLPYSGGLKRNIVQCLEDFGIPLLLSHTVVRIEGRERVTAVVLAQVDDQRRPIPGTEQTYPCDTLLLSCGLIPENELSRGAGAALDAVTGGPVVDQGLETSIPGVFACGNVLHVHDLVDFVSQEAALAGRQAASYLQAPRPAGRTVAVKPGPGVRYVVPQFLDPAAMDGPVTLRFRVAAPARRCAVTLTQDGRTIQRKKRPVVAPGEMESLEISARELQTSDLTVGLEAEARPRRTRASTVPWAAPSP